MQIAFAIAMGVAKVAAEALFFSGRKHDFSENGLRRCLKSPTDDSR